MLRTLSDSQVVAFDSSQWEQKHIERWMRIHEINTVLSPFMSDNPSARFLDLGGGTGRFSDLLLAAYESSSAIVGDASEFLLSRNRPHRRKTVLCVDASRLTQTFQSASLDVIFVHRLLHHLVGDSYAESIGIIRNVLCQCAAILKPTGRLSIIENIWNGRFVDKLAGQLLYLATSSRTLAPAARRLGANTAGTGICYVSDRFLIRMLQDAGFGVQTRQTLGTFRFPWYIRYPTLLKNARSVHYWCKMK